MPSFPSIQSGTITIGPFARTRRFPVGIASFYDGTSQRWLQGPDLLQFEIRMENITYAERQMVETFFDLVRGARDAWDVTFPGYSPIANCVFADDRIQFVESDFPGLYSASLRVETIG